MKQLVKSVREDRKANKICLSAQDNVNIPEMLTQILETGFYKKDYQEVTMKLLYRPVKYDEAIKSLETIVESGLLSNETK